MTLESMVTPGRPGRIEGDTESPSPELVATLRQMMVGNDGLLHERVREAVMHVADVPTGGLTYAHPAHRAPELLRTVINELGGSGFAIAADPRVRGILCEWSAAVSPGLLTVLTGHFDLASGAIAASGVGNDYVRRCAEILDTGTAVGILALRAW